MPTYVLGNNTGNDLAGCTTTRIEEVTPDDPAFGDALNLRGNPPVRKGLVVFDGLEDPILDGLTVTSGFLRLWTTQDLFGDTWDIYELLRNWIDGEVTWNSYATGSAWASPGAQGTGDSDSTSSGSGVTPLTIGFFDFTLTAAGIAAVQDIIDGGPNYGWLIVSSGLGSEPAAGASGTDGTRPELHITGDSGGGTDFVGTGALTASEATASGSGVLGHPGSGALTVSVETISGSGSRTSNDTGGPVSLQSQTPTVSGSGSVNGAPVDYSGTGALSAGTPTVAGSGTIVGGASGTGALTVSSPTVSGAGIRTSVGTGALSAQTPLISGTNQPFNPNSRYMNGTAVAPDGTMQVLTLGDGNPVPVDAVFINGIAHSGLGQRYIALWPASGIVTYQSGRAIRTDGAQIVLAASPFIYLAGFGYTVRGELCVTNTPGPNFVQGYSVNNGQTAVSLLP